MANVYKVKGTGLNSTKKYVSEKHPNLYNNWINSLPDNSKKMYNGTVNTTEWYDVEHAYYYPMKKIAEMFFNNNEQKAAYEIGEFSAEFALKGVYKVYLMIATPQNLMKAAKRIIAKYYDPVTVEIDDIEKKSLILSTTKIHRSSMLDYRTIGWCVRALELAHCNNVKYEKIESRYPNMFSVKLSWS